MPSSTALIRFRSSRFAARVCWRSLTFPVSWRGSRISIQLNPGPVPGVVTSPGEISTAM
ncbi:hypothetical protein D3261_03070 [Halococcus sp. IIIV-5B]|nr:hypothetical protein D3261_03070 [Halococcus sp. IIIV-5B]